MESATAFETALAAQRAAIAKEARESDTLLLVDFMVKDSVNRVQQFSTTKMKDEGITALSRSTPAGVRQPSGGPGAQVAQRTYAAQNSANVTIVKVQGSSITSMLPAGVPVIDHLAAWASITPGWSTLTPTTSSSPNTGHRSPASASPPITGEGYYSFSVLYCCLLAEMDGMYLSKNNTTTKVIN
jgi:hypothetical protein